MSEKLICDCCGETVKVKPTVATCVKCRPAEKQFEQFVGQQLAELQDELRANKLEWMRQRGAPIDANRSKPIKSRSGAAPDTAPSQSGELTVKQPGGHKPASGRGGATLN